MKEKIDNLKLDGFPDEVFKQIRENRIWHWKVVSILGLITAYALYSLIFKDGDPGLTSIACAVFIFFGWLSLPTLLRRYNTYKHARIVPYFERAVPGEDTFGRGHAIAQNCRFLDELAMEAGVKPLSAFGFEDEHTSKKAQWFNPEEAIQTIEILMNKLLYPHDHINDKNSLIGELDRIRKKLTEAQKRKSLFCFHIRYDSAVSPLEFDNRKGRYFPTWKDREVLIEEEKLQP